MMEDKVFRELGLLKDEAARCVRCGTCRSVCPTFRILGRETACARGKLTLIRAYLEGGISLTEDFIRHAKECTMCGACRDSCPNGVDTTGIIQAARAEAVKKAGLSTVAGFVLRNILDSERLMPLAMKFASRVKGLLLKESPDENGLISRFSLPVIGNNRLLPNLAKEFFLELPEVKALSDVKTGGPRRPGRPGRPGGVRTRVAFYAGCGVNYLMPEVGAASLDVMKRAGADLVVPPEQVCCGMPAYYMGDMETARRLAVKNLEAFESAGADFIATSCATCGHGLKNVFKEILSGEGPELKARAEAFSGKVRDITELLAGELRFKGGGAPGRADLSGKTVTYHDPCHLNRNQGIRHEPRELIALNRSVRFKEMRFPCSCCGLGGGVNYANYDLSIEITKRKAESVRDSGAQIVATACPGCIVQIRDGLHRYGVDAKVVHVVELL